MMAMGMVMWEFAVRVEIRIGFRFSTFTVWVHGLSANDSHFTRLRLLAPQVVLNPHLIFLTTGMFIKILTLTGGARAKSVRI